MRDHRLDFIQFAVNCGVLCFGKFTLKSGRISPYFFNAGLFNNGKALSFLGEAYAHAVRDSSVKVDMLFGPAYKGIPLVSATAVAYYNKFNINMKWCFNRKEVKDHGEGGTLVGAQLKGKVVIIDDVITAGTAIRDVLPCIQRSAEVVAIVVAIDRQERPDHHSLSTVQLIEQECNIPVISIVTLHDIMAYARQELDAELVTLMEVYQARYCVL